VTTLPVALTVTSALNAMAHAAEALYATNRTSGTTALAIEGLTAFRDGLPAVMANPTDLAAREATQRGAWACGTVLGQVGMALHHKLCHTLGGSFDLPHAQTHAILLPHAIAYNARAAKAELHPICDLLGGDNAGLALHGFAKRMEAPLALRDLGLREADLDRAAELARHPRVATGCLGRRNTHNRINDVREDIMLTRRKLLKSTAATGLTLTAGGLAAPALAQGAKIRLGYVSPQSGPLAAFSEADQFEVIVKDSQSNPNRAAEVAKELIIDDEIDMMLVASTPETTNPVATTCEAEEIPVISTVAPWQPYFIGQQGTGCPGLQPDGHGPLSEPDGRFQRADQRLQGRELRDRDWRAHSAGFHHLLDAGQAAGLYPQGRQHRQGDPVPAGRGGASAGDLASAYTAATGRQWTQPIGFVHALFEMAADVMGRVEDSRDPDEVTSAIAATELSSMVGRIAFDGAGLPPFATQNVAKTPLVGVARWKKFPDLSLAARGSLPPSLARPVSRGLGPVMSILSLKSVSKSFGALTVTDNASFDVPQGQALGIIGPNGAGKSTLFNLITGNLRADAGSVHFEGRDVTRVSAMERCLTGIGRSFQIPQPR